MFPRLLAPAPTITPERIFGCRSSHCLPVPPRVTSWSIDTSSSITAVSPTTRPVAWSRKIPRPIFAERGRVFQRARIGLPDQLAGQRGVIKPFGQPVDDGALETVVMQNGRIEE